MSNSWFFRPQPRPNAKTKLFIFHHAGGSASYYHKWHKVIPEATELVLVELPGRGRRHAEAPIEDFEELMIELRAQFFLEGAERAAFFGHSLGGLIAFELARSVKPLRLGISSILPPIESNAHRREKLSLLEDQELIQKLSVYSPLPEEVLRDPDVLGFYLKIIRSDLRLIDSYLVKRRPLLEVPTLVFGGRNDTGLKPRDLEGWSQLCTIIGPVNVFGGGHFYLNLHFQQILVPFLSSL